MRELDAGEEDDAADEARLAPPRMTRADSFATLRAMFPEVPDDALREAMERHPGDVNRAAERILCAGPPPGPKPSFATAARVEGWAPVVPSRSRARYDDASAAAEVPVGGDRVDDVLSEVRRRQTPAPAASAGGRGDDASQHATRRYLTRLHEECVVLQRSRASLSALSRAAYSRGDGRQASQLSARAAAVQIQIDAARASAAAASLKYHNANGGGGGGGGGRRRAVLRRRRRPARPDRGRISPDADRGLLGGARDEERQGRARDRRRGEAQRRRRREGGSRGAPRLGRTRRSVRRRKRRGRVAGAVRVSAELEGYR